MFIAPPFNQRKSAAKALREVYRKIAIANSRRSGQAERNGILTLPYRRMAHAGHAEL
jgi:hypothetical protein